MRIAEREIGPDHPPFIIAEVAQAHDGSLGMAASFIDIAAECGADAVKFQTHIASEESTAAEPWRVPFSKQDASRYNYWERMSFSRESWSFLKARAEEKGLIFLSSAFSVMACDWLEELDMPAWKVASGEVYNEELLSRMERSGRPIILSSGLNSFALSEKLVNRFTAKGIDVALLHCTTMYPTPPEEVGLNVMETFREHFADRAIVGLSDHSGTPYPGIVAAYNGASMIEAHITFHHAMFGPDVPASLDIEEFKTLVKGARFAWEMRRAGVDKGLQLNSVARESKMFTRSLVARVDLSAGQVISADDLAYKKPGGGMAYEERDSLIGKVLKTDVARDTPLDGSMVRETSA
jgi:N,N'-diacetyllegionaminate synthase